MVKTIIIKRVYEKPSRNDGYRMLVDRIWPRGISKEVARLDEWNKNIAPSTDLRKWFGHREDRYAEFAKRYKDELHRKADELNRIRALADRGKLCLVYGAKSERANQAVILQQVLLADE